MPSLKHPVKKENRKRSSTSRPHPPHKLNKRYWDELRAAGQANSPTNNQITIPIRSPPLNPQILPPLSQIPPNFPPFHHFPFAGPSFLPGPPLPLPLSIIMPPNFLLPPPIPSPVDVITVDHPDDRISEPSNPSSDDSIDADLDLHLRRKVEKNSRLPIILPIPIPIILPLPLTAEFVRKFIMRK